MSMRLVLAAVLLTAVLPSAAAQGDASAYERDAGPLFVRVDGTRFTIDGRPYYFVGTNFWYGAWLGADAPYGDRRRLVRELDRLQRAGITNLRIAAASEESDASVPISPPFQYKDGTYDETLLQGLDFLLAEMGKRDMRGVLFLNNFWDWTGGMSQYVAWATGEPIVDPVAHPEQTWDDLIDFSARFYTNPEAQARYRRYIETLVTRTNSVTGVAYRDDPAIMAWQLANEPRPAKNVDPAESISQFAQWIDGTATFIDSLDTNHLISTGNEGSKGTLNTMDHIAQTNQSAHVDYMTIHLWPKNWGWYRAAEPETMERTMENTRAYLADHEAIATALNKPLVLEEFGFVRDREAFSPDSTTAARDAFFQFVLQQVQESIQSGGPLAGVNVWGWGGEGRALHDDHVWRVGDVSYVADPYSEPQGVNSVYDTDRSTLGVLSGFARQFRAMPQASAAP